MSRSPLPSEFVDRWHLRPDGKPIAGNNADVFPVLTHDGRPAVLRVGDPDGDSAAAWRALECWAGDGAVLLLAADRASDVLLLERLDASVDLDSLPIQEAISVAAELRARLLRTAPTGLPTRRAVTAGWEAQLRSASPVLPAGLADRAASICRGLRSGAGSSHLVNMDLHYRNVLTGTRAPWLVIDPMPIAGDPEFGIASLIWGRSPEAKARDLLRVVSDVGGLDQERVRSWTFVETAVKLLTASGPVGQRCLAVLADLGPRV